MVTAREIMHEGVECVNENETLMEAARRMRELRIGSLPICGDDDRLRGIITDRDIVVNCIAQGGDPSAMTARDLAQGSLVWVEADADEQEVIRAMADNLVRRVPVIDNHRLIGMISEADVATHLSEEEIAEYVRTIYSAPPSS
jgi:CBS domain-containing protein